MQALLGACLYIFLSSAAWSLRFGGRVVSQRGREKLFAFEQNKEDGSWSDTSGVKDVLSQILESIKPVASKELGGSVEDLTLEDVASRFQKIFADIKDSSQLTEMEKRMLYTEASFTLKDAEAKDGNANLYALGASNRLSSATFKTKIYSQTTSPVLLVCGPGPVGQKLLELGKSLGKSAAFRFLDAEYLAVVQDSELSFAVRDARAIIIAADCKGGDKSGKPFVVDSKGIKRLLNAAMNERNKSTKSYDVKIVAMTLATKPPKSLASFFGGDNTELDSEVILQCQQRGLGYAVVKVGAIVPDESAAALARAGKVKSRSASALLPTLPAAEEEVAVNIPPVPIAFTSSRVEASEYTTVSVAVEALLRSSTHPQTNSSIAVLSADSLGRMPTEAEWDDEFLRIEGPELERIPLRFASEMQIAIKVGRIAKQLMEPNSGLITPITVERFANGVRILFRPPESNYVSSKEEKKQALAEEDNTTNGAIKATKPTGYVSPEMEALFEKQKAGEDTVVAAKSKRKPTQEGGLEIIVDSSPYRRVRIRRCNMGPQTIVKEESEAIILKALQRGITSIEADYKKMIMSRDAPV